MMAMQFRKRTTPEEDRVMVLFFERFVKGETFGVREIAYVWCLINSEPSRDLPNVAATFKFAMSTDVLAYVTRTLLAPVNEDRSTEELLKTYPYARIV
jgi:hypothetical protein